MSFLIISIILNLFQTQVYAQNFTAQALCEDPYKFVCNSNAPALDSFREGRISEVMTALRNEFPSVDFYMRYNFNPPMTLNKFENFGALMENAARKRYAFELRSRLATRLKKIPHKDVVAKGSFNMVKTKSLTPLASNAYDGLRKLPPEDLSFYFSGISKALEVLGVDYDKINREITKDDPFLRRIMSDFYGSNSVDHMLFKLDLKSAAAKVIDRKKKESYAAVKRHFEDQKRSMMTYLKENSPEGMKEKLLDTGKRQKMVPSSQEFEGSCHRISLIGSGGAHVEDTNMFCEGENYLNGGPTFKNNQTFAHEFSHGLTNGLDPLEFAGLRNCLLENYSDTLMYRDKKISVLPKAEAREAIVKNTAEWLSDSFAASFLAFKFKEDTLSETAALRQIFEEFQLFCRETAENQFHLPGVSSNQHPQNADRI